MMKRLTLALLGLLLAWVCPLTVHSAVLSAAQIFERVAPAVAKVELLNDQGKVIDHRTAVLVDNNRWVTVCEGVASAESLNLVLPSGQGRAKLAAQDTERNLCVLFMLNPIPTGPPLLDWQREPLPGSRVFAVSNALALGVGISDGLVAAIRTFAVGAYIQFSAPVSPGAQGGALVDDDGRLLGIIDYRHRAGQNVNFAAPAAWIAQIDDRAAGQRVENEWAAQAARLVQQRRWDSLDDLSKKWSAASPNSAAAWGYAAYSAEALADTKRAELAWRKLQSLEPDSSNAGRGLVRLLFQQGRFDEALSLVEKLLAQDRQNASVWLLYGRLLQSLQKPLEAETAYRRATELDPWLLETYPSLAALVRQRGDFSAAIAIWTKLAGLVPSEPEFRYALVQSLLDADQAAQAFRALGRLPAADADSAKANYWRAQTLRKLGRPVEAVETLRKSIAKQTTGAGAGAQSWLVLSDLLSDLRRNAESIEAAQQALQAEPGNDAAKLWLAVRLKDGGRAQEALVMTSELIVRLPKNASAWRVHGISLYVLARWEEAKAAFEKSLSLDPKQVRVWTWLVIAQHAMGDELGARRSYEKLQALEPRAAQNLYRSVIVTYEAGEP